MDDKTRNVFDYFDGRQRIFADPMAVHRRLVHALDGDPNRVLAEADAGRAGPREEYPSEEEWQAALERQALAEPTAYAATERLIAAVRDVFRMAPFDPATGEGATEESCRAALEAFVEYQKKKRILP